MPTAKKTATKEDPKPKDKAPKPAPATSDALRRDLEMEK